jgi:hypothetical protein
MMKKTQEPDHQDQRVLHLMLKHEHFAKVLEGRKSYEFLDLSDYWKSGLEGRDYDLILFRCGPLPAAPEMLVEFAGCEMWSHSYAIKLGRIVELSSRNSGGKGPALRARSAIGQRRIISLPVFPAHQKMTLAVMMLLRIAVRTVFTTYDRVVNCLFP